MGVISQPHFTEYNITFLLRKDFRLYNFETAVFSLKKPSGRVLEINCRNIGKTRKLFLKKIYMKNCKCS